MELVNGFGVLRDGIACKPAVMAETDQYVAFGSEYRVLADPPQETFTMIITDRTGRRERES